MGKRHKLLITCEHGGNTIPRKYRYLFDNTDILDTHRAFDPGALQLARKIAGYNHCDLKFETISRLLVDQNRSIGNASLFSCYSKLLSPKERELLLNRYYTPYHQEIHSILQSNRSSKLFTIHFSIHSFTPVLNNKIRHADLGLLYDPSRTIEQAVAEQLKECIHEKIPELRIRKNYPYKGISDGLTSAMRKVYDQSLYCGIEIEINQKHVLDNSSIWRSLQQYLPLCIKEISLK